MNCSLDSCNNFSTTIYSTSTQSVLARVAVILLLLYNYLTAYYVPCVILLAIFNNTICLSVFLLSRGFKTKTSQNVRLFYIALAIADICASIISRTVQCTVVIL